MPRDDLVDLFDGDRFPRRVGVGDQFVNRSETVGIQIQADGLRLVPQDEGQVFADSRESFVHSAQSKHRRLLRRRVIRQRNHISERTISSDIQNQAVPRSFAGVSHKSL